MTSLGVYIYIYSQNIYTYVMCIYILQSITIYFRILHICMVNPRSEYNLINLYLKIDDQL